MTAACFHCGTPWMPWPSLEWEEHVQSPEHLAKVADYGLNAEAQRGFNEVGR